MTPEHGSISVTDFVKPQPGLNLRLFSHDGRLTFLILHADKSSLSALTHQICGAIRDGKSIVVSTSRKHRYLLVNPTLRLLFGLVATIAAASNMPFVHQIISLFPK